jgi:hypothetical protein
MPFLLGVHENAELAHRNLGRNRFAGLHNLPRGRRKNPFDNYIHQEERREVVKPFASNKILLIYVIK